MIKINNRIDPICKLLYNGEVVGTIRNNTALLDVMAQIAESKADGYAVKFKGNYYPINTDGRLYNVPEGFYDSASKSLRKIMGVE